MKPTHFRIIGGQAPARVVTRNQLADVLRRNRRQYPSRTIPLISYNTGWILVTFDDGPDISYRIAERREIPR